MESTLAIKQGGVVMEANVQAEAPSGSEFTISTTERGPLFDKAIALMGLAFLAPLMLLVAIAIVSETGFPVFFSQDRLGRGGMRFRMYKFRKFSVCGESCGRPVTLANDKRFTNVGKFLEKIKLDEIPQLWNVLIGDMALVGPRPEVPAFAECYQGSARRILEYRPGVFGPSQAMFRSEGSLYPSGEDPTVFYRAVLFPAKASLDLAYYPSRTFSGDLKWIVCCLAAICGLEPCNKFTVDAVDSVRRATGHG
jgi:lipopolysaccharide/colanic/teichoic acid biosynthesis glycosyltransferase